jgi:hypothetical protein
MAVVVVVVIVFQGWVGGWGDDVVLVSGFLCLVALLGFFGVGFEETDETENEVFKGIAIEFFSDRGIPTSCPYVLF